MATVRKTGAKPVKARRREPAAVPKRREGSEKPAAPQHRDRMIAEAAYFKAERRGFAAGRELDDWLAAEAEIDRAYGADPPV